MKSNSNTMVIFGGTGDLTHRKLIPALYQLDINGFLPEGLNVISVGRKYKTTEEYRNELRESVKKYSSRSFTEELFNDLAQRVEYFTLDFDSQKDYNSLSAFLNEREKEGKPENRLFYLAVSPDYFGKIVDSCEASGITAGSGWRRLVIEKPFGKDLESATALNTSISRVFPEKSIYRIDHYVAKEMIQNIMMLRFQNSIFESIWNRSHIDNVQITVLEKEGVGTRGGYYDHTGALRDMVQNHLLQLLAITAMEPPKSLDPDDVRDEKVRVFQALKDCTAECTEGNVLFGQYEGYGSEDKVPHDSRTETLVAARVQIDNDRWRGVPFYLLTGKALRNKTAQVTIEFRKLASLASDIQQEPNILEIKIQPDEGITLHLSVKKPGVIDEMVQAEMDYCQSCLYLFNSPDSYEKLILDAMTGDSTRFTRWDELELTWSYIDSILRHAKDNVTPKCYEIGSDGPDELDTFIKSGSGKWWYRNRTSQYEYTL